MRRMGELPDRRSSINAPRWVRVFRIIAIVLVLIVVILHLTGHGFGGHGMMAPIVAALRHDPDAELRDDLKTACRQVHYANRVARKRNAFPITVTELSAIAAPAIIGLSRSPKVG